MIVRGFFDSPFMLDVPSMNRFFRGFQEQHAGVLAHFNSSSVIPQACAEAYRGDERWKCLFGQYRMPFVRTPYLIIHARFDTWQLKNNVDTSDGIHKDELAFIRGFGAKGAALLSTLPSALTLWAA